MELKIAEEKEQKKLESERQKKEREEQKKIEKARKAEETAAEERMRIERECQKIRDELTRASEAKRKQLESQLAQYKKLAEKALEDEQKARESRRRIKGGYIYVLSCKGSFEDDIYRICMTQRSSEPEKYVTTMNPCVPFPYHIRFEIESEDASTTLEQLHNRFSNQRVNIVNSRRDFFKVNLGEIRKAIQDIRKETEDFSIQVEEKEINAFDDEYFRTMSMRGNR